MGIIYNMNVRVLTESYISVNMKVSLDKFTKEVDTYFSKHRRKRHISLMNETKRSVAWTILDTLDDTFHGLIY